MKISHWGMSIGFVFSLTAACGDDGSGGSGATGGDASGGSASTGGASSSGGSGGSANACPVDLCSTYGAAVPDVVSAIVDDAAADPMFMADFAPLVAEGPAAVTAFKASLTNFITDAYKCTTGKYTGPGMVQAHTGMNITQGEYDAFLGIIVEKLKAAGVTDDHVSKCFAPALTDPAFAATIIGH